jgi:hypothetical protein
MNIDENELKSIIRRIAERIIREMLAPEKTERGALALVPAFVPDAVPVLQYLKEKCGAEAACAGEGAEALDGTLRRIASQTPQDRQRLMSRLKGFKDIVLVCPPLWMLKSIASGDDRGFFEQAVMRSLLWHKNVTVLLDFEKPGFGRSEFFQQIGDALKALEDMGAKVVSLKLSVCKPEDELALVTEAEVRDAHGSGRGRIRCADGAIVTPLARDAARELGMEIDE